MVDDDDLLHHGFTRREIRRADRRFERGHPGKSGVSLFIAWVLVGMLLSVVGCLLAWALVASLNLLVSAL